MPGFIRISRDLFDDPTFASVRFPRPWALIDLVQLARYKQGSEYVNGRVVSLERGQLCKSIRWLATRWRWDEKTVQSFIRSLIIGGVITYEFPQSNKGVTGIISIVNYDNFVGDSYTPSHTTSHTTSDTLYKEIKKEEEKKTSKDVKEKNCRFVKPTIEQIHSYCLERGYAVDAERFYDYYESKGWVVGRAPMKDWKAAVRTWAAKNRNMHADADTPARQKTITNINISSGGFDF